MPSVLKKTFLQNMILKKMLIPLVANKHSLCGKARPTSWRSPPTAARPALWAAHAPGPAGGWWESPRPQWTLTGHSCHLPPWAHRRTLSLPAAASPPPPRSESPLGTDEAYLRESRTHKVTNADWDDEGSCFHTPWHEPLCCCVYTKSPPIGVSGAGKVQPRHLGLKLFAATLNGL